MFCFKDINGCELIGLASSIAIYICQNSSDDETEALAAFFTALGDNLTLCIVNHDNETGKFANKNNQNSDNSGNNNQDDGVKNKKENN